DRHVGNHFLENEQIAFGTGVLVDGLDFSDDTMLVGRTFSYSDTQRYRVGPNYLQLPVNKPKNAHVATNQQGGPMAYGIDDVGSNPHVNYEPSITGGLREAEAPTPDEQGPEIRGRLTRKRIPRTNDYEQAGQRYQLMAQWEKDDLVKNLVAGIGEAVREVQERMVWHFFLCDDELGERVGEGLGITADDVRGLPPLQSQTLSEEERQRAAKLGKNGPRGGSGLEMTHCVPNERWGHAAWARWSAQAGRAARVRPAGANASRHESHSPRWAAARVGSIADSCPKGRTSDEPTGSHRTAIAAPARPRLRPDPRRRAARRGRGRRHRLQLGSLLPAQRRPRGRALRVLDHARRLRRADRARRDRRAGHRRRLPQPRPARRHGPHRRPHQRRPPDPRHRRRLVPEGLRRVRLRIRHRRNPSGAVEGIPAPHHRPPRQAQPPAHPPHTDPHRRRR